MSKLDYRCRGSACDIAATCRRHMPAAKNSALPFAAFDVREGDTCDGYLPRIPAPIRVESEGGEA